MSDTTFTNDVTESDGEGWAQDINNYVYRSAPKWCGTAGGTADAITISAVSTNLAITAYLAGQSYMYKSGASVNTGAMTVAVDGLATKAIQKNGAALVAGDHPASTWFRITYDGAAFQLEQIAPAIGFQTISVAGQSNVEADAAHDTLTLAAGANITITTNSATDTITFAAGTAALGPAAYLTAVPAGFGVITTTAGTIEANSANATLNLAVGAGLVTTVDSATDTITISLNSAGDTARAGFGIISFTAAASVEAATANDGFTFLQGNNIVFTSDSANDTITIAAGTATFGNAAYLNAGVSALELVRLDGAAKLPAVDGSQLTNLPAGGFTLGAPVASTSGTAITFTGIPNTAKCVKVNFVGVSTNGTSNILLQLGDSGGIETAGYSCEAAQIGSTNSDSSAGFLIKSASADATLSGTITITLESQSANTWCCAGEIANTGGHITFTTTGDKSTSAVLDRVSITTVGGTDAFDAGQINISYL